MPYIEARAETKRSVIQWVNNTGDKNDFFLVEKANNVTGQFEQLEIVNNQSKDNNPTNYVAYDNAPTEGDDVYRVTAVFTDGSTKVSEPKTITFGKPSTVNVYPNPATSELNIELKDYKDGPLSM